MYYKYKQPNVNGVCTLLRNLAFCYSFPTFHNFVNIKLDRTNYPLWLAQILPILKSRDLMGYVEGLCVYPPKHIAGNAAVNLAYTTWFNRTKWSLAGSMVPSRHLSCRPWLANALRVRPGKLWSNVMHPPHRTRSCFCEMNSCKQKNVIFQLMIFLIKWIRFLITLPWLAIGVGLVRFIFFGSVSVFFFFFFSKNWKKLRS